MDLPLASLGRLGRRDSKSSISVSISSVSTDDDSSTDSTKFVVKRQKLQPRRSSSLKKAIKNMAVTTNETNKTLKNSNSAQRLMNKFNSLTKKMDYQKIDTSNRTWISDLSSKDSHSTKTNPKSKSNTKSSTPPRHRPGVRRARSCNDDLTSLYKTALGVDVTEERDTSYHASPRRYSELIGNPQSADDDDTDSTNHSFVPDTLSTPNLLNRTAVASRRNPLPSTISGSSKTPNKSSHDLLTQAAAIAGRKQRRLHHPPNLPTSSNSREAELEERLDSTTTSASSTEMFIQTKSVLGQRLSATQPAFSSSYNHLPRAGAVAVQKQRRRSDPTLDLSEFPDLVPQPDPIIRAISVLALSAEEKEKRRRRSGSSSDRTPSDGSAGNNRRRSKRTSDPEKQRPQPPNGGEEQRRNLFRKDFPDEPIPSDVILVRLYGTNQIPPPPPYTTNIEDQVTPPPRNASIKSIVKPLSPEDVEKNDDTSYSTFETELEWKAWKASVDKKRRRNKSKYPTKHPTAEAFIKGNYVRDDSRRSESSKSKNSAASSRRSSSGKTPGVLSYHRESRSDGTDRPHSRSHTGSRHRARHSSRTKGEASNSGRENRNSLALSSSIHDTSGEAKPPKSKGNKRRDGLSHSSHDTTYSPSEASSRSKARKRGETIKTKTKTATPAPRSSNRIAEDLIEMAMLDLSNGSFFDNEEVSENSNSASLAFLNTSLTRMNSVKSCDDIAEFSGDCGENPDKERKKKRRGKRSGSVGSEGQTRSKSADGRSGAKTRRGKRSSSRSSPKMEEPKPYSISGSQRSLNTDNRGSQRRSPKLTSGKNSINEGGTKQRKSPKFTPRKHAVNDSRSPKSPSKPTKRGSSLKSYNAPMTPRHQLGPSQVAEKEESQNGDDDFYDLALASWVDGPTETPKTTKTSISRIEGWTDGPTETPRTVKTYVSKIDLPRRKDPTSKTCRWQSEPASMWSPYTVKSISDTVAARVPDFADFDTNTPRSRSAVEMRAPASKSAKAINFPLNFVEHQNVSPLTVASKKVPNNPFLPMISSLDT